MYKIIASDLDETFMTTEHEIVESNILGLKYLKENNVLFVPSSGRPYWSIMESFENLEDLLEGSYVISVNGGCINKVGDNQPIYTKCLTFDQVKEVYAYGKELGLGIHIYEADGPVWTVDLTETEKAHLSGLMKTSNIGDETLAFLKDKKISKMIYLMEDLEWLEENAPKIQSRFEFADISISANVYIEINPSGVDKGLALKYLADYLGVAIEDTIALGDSTNDIEMLKAAGVGVVVSNATDQTKQIADYVAQSSCRDGILLEVINKYLK